MEKSVYFNRLEFAVATSPEEAEEIIKKTFGDDHLDHEEATEFYAVLDTMEIAVDTGGEIVKKTAEAWAKEKKVGYLCSVDF